MGCINQKQWAVEEYKFLHLKQFLYWHLILHYSCFVHFSVDSQSAYTLDLKGMSVKWLWGICLPRCPISGPLWTSSKNWKECGTFCLCLALFWQRATKAKHTLPGVEFPRRKFGRGRRRFRRHRYAPVVFCCSFLFCLQFSASERIEVKVGDTGHLNPRRLLGEALFGGCSLF